MTTNQIALQQLAETKRANEEKEAAARKELQIKDADSITKQREAAVKEREAAVKEAELWKTKILGFDIPFAGLIKEAQDLRRNKQQTGKIQWY